MLMMVIREKCKPLPEQVEVLAWKDGVEGWLEIESLSPFEETLFAR